MKHACICSSKVFAKRLKFVMIAILIFADFADAASVNVTISSQNVLNGTFINMTAIFDPTIGSPLLRDLECGYTNPGGILFTPLTLYNSFIKRIQNKVLSSNTADIARLNITSTGNPMVLEISPIIFEDEKRTFHCVLHYYDRDGNPFNLDSQKITLDNVYCE